MGAQEGIPGLVQVRTLGVIQDWRQDNNELGKAAPQNNTRPQTTPGKLCTAKPRRMVSMHSRYLLGTAFVEL